MILLDGQFYEVNNLESGHMLFSALLCFPSAQVWERSVVKWVENLITLFALKCSGVVRKFGQRISGSRAVNLAFLSNAILKVFRKRRGKSKAKTAGSVCFSFH